MEKSFKKVSNLLFKLNITLDFTSKKSGNNIYIPLNNKAKIVYESFRFKPLDFNEKNFFTYKVELCEFALHEIGHFIITPKQRRRRKDYGIPDGKNSENFKYSFEEVKATMIENELKRLFGFKFDKKLYGQSNVDPYFIPTYKEQILLWWEAEGKLLAKTYADLA